MPALALYLQQEFLKRSLPGWECLSEVCLLSRDLEQFLGYSPRADVLLQRTDHAKRLWIEFEISRADPVANHAKFATSHLFEPQRETDVFVSMISSHVQRDGTDSRFDGRRARLHLTQNLGMQEIRMIDNHEISQFFEQWLDI